MNSSTPHHTKTSLKKIKKDELVEMFLTSQADLLNFKMENEELKEELKEVIRVSDISLGIIKEENEVNKKNMFRFMEENEVLKREGYDLRKAHILVLEELKEQLRHNLSIFTEGGGVCEVRGRKWFVKDMEDLSAELPAELLNQIL